MGRNLLHCRDEVLYLGSGFFGHLKECTSGGVFGAKDLKLQFSLHESAKISQSTNSFGNDLLFELFSWMPAKGVIQYFSSKTLSTVLSEPLFHYRQSINSSHLDGGFFLQPDTCWNAGDNLDFHVLPRDPPSLFGIPTESLSFLQQNGRILASSQGLVLLHKLVKGTDEFLICNTVTKRCTPLPIPDKLQFERFMESGLLIECHPRNLNTSAKVDFNDYTITTPVLVDDETDPWCYGYRLAVYRNGKWDDNTCDLRIHKGRQLRLDTPVGVFRGPDKSLVIHYLCDSLPNALRRPVSLEPYVVAYDVERKELWRSFKLPKGAWMEDGDHTNLKIFKWGTGETMGLVRTDKRRLTVWVLEDYERASWRRVVAETTEEMGVPEEEGGVVGCCVVNGKDLVFATESRVYVYEMEGPDAGRLEVVGEHGCREAARVVFTLYANTFRPVCGGESRVVKF